MRILILAIVAIIGVVPFSAFAAGTCRVVNVEMTPGDNLQIVVWIEDVQGNFVDTAFITRTTGSFGLGNRPGIMQFNSGPNWCYGRRETTFPVWAHRHGMDWPKMIFQDGDDDDLSHGINQSSLEMRYCRPLRPSEELWDAQSCATTVYTDKGKFADGERSLYPPRNDVTLAAGPDSPDVSVMVNLNPFDAVSKPTPLGGQAHQTAWPIPDTLPDGDYVAWVEVSKEFDQNADYDYPAVDGIAWSEYGIAYRGQPSVIYRVPFSIGADTPGMSMDYVGYGDPDGIDGVVREPDTTITTGVAGSGASRLLLTSDGDSMYRVRVQANSSDDFGAPGRAKEMRAGGLTADQVTVTFVAPGDDGEDGRATSYEVRYIAGTEIDESNWDAGIVVPYQQTPGLAGTIEEVHIEGLLPNTNYSIGVRAADECLNTGAIARTHVVTPEADPGRVDACFVATAAYGSLMANEVVALRSFRDRFLRTHPAGELLVESYYAFGPVVAKLIQGTPLWRRVARAAISPLVEGARRLSASEK